jgi:hypothetical protein
MIQNFEHISAQLKELAPIINSFKSETVQLRIVELIFGAQQPGAEASEEPVEEQASGSPKRERKARATRPTTRSTGTPAPRKKANGTGPMSTLTQLAADGFFDKRQTLSKIVDHCKSKKARIFKLSDMSGPLGRAVRDGLLEREKNADGQYEYWKK